MYLPNVCLTRNITAVTHTTVCRPLSIAWMVRIFAIARRKGRSTHNTILLICAVSLPSTRAQYSKYHISRPQFGASGRVTQSMRLCRVAYSCPICASITRKYITYLIAAGEVPSDGRNMLKNCEDRACSSGDMFADRQTRRQTDRETRSSQYSTE